MNDAKSAPFTYIVKIKNPCIPQSSQKKPTFWQNYTKFAHHFRFGLREMETPNITANSMKSTQFASPHGKSHEISAVHANF